MTIQEAKSLLPDNLAGESKQCWADLGCGDGIFTYALAEKLFPGSEVIAMDKNYQKLNRRHSQVSINFVQGDIERDIEAFSKLDGIIMANAFHFIEKKKELIESFKNILTENPRWIIIEYDHRKANAYVPYPLPFGNLETLFRYAGYTTIKKTGVIPSIYGGEMYVALITK